MAVMIKMMQVWLCGLLFFGGTADVMAAGVPDEAVKKLSSDQFEVRASAYVELEKWSKKNVKTSPELLRKVWSESKDPEVKTRCYELMKKAVLVRKFGKGKGFVGIMMDPMVIRQQLGKQPKGVKPQQEGKKPKVQVKRGINIAQVLPNTPGQKAGLKAGDVILGIDQLDFNKLPEENQAVDVRSLFQIYVASKQPDDVITLHLIRGGEKMDKGVTLMKRPSSADLDPFGNSRVADKEREEQEAFFDQWLGDE